MTVRFRWQALVKKNWQAKYPATLKQHETKNTIRKNSTSPKHHNQVVWSEDSEHLSISLNFKVLNLVEYLCTHRWAKTNCQISAFNVATMTLVRLLKRVSSWESIKLVAKLSVHQHAPELFVEWLCSEYLVFPSSSWVLQAPDKVGEKNLWTRLFWEPSQCYNCGVWSRSVIVPVLRIFKSPKKHSIIDFHTKAKSINNSQICNMSFSWPEHFKVLLVVVMFNPLITASILIFSNAKPSNAKSIAASGSSKESHDSDVYI